MNSYGKKSISESKHVGPDLFTNALQCEINLLMVRSFTVLNVSDHFLNFFRCLLRYLYLLHRKQGIRDTIKFSGPIRGGSSGSIEPLDF